MLTGLNAGCHSLATKSLLLMHRLIFTSQSTYCEILEAMRHAARMNRPSTSKELWDSASAGIDKAPFPYLGSN